MARSRSRADDMERLIGLEDQMVVPRERATDRRESGRLSTVHEQSEVSDVVDEKAEYE